MPRASQGATVAAARQDTTRPSRRDAPRTPHGVERVAAIRSAALGCFSANGYHGTAVRDIAGAAGTSVASIYHHYPSKLEILFEIMDGTMSDLVHTTEDAIAGAGSDPVERLRAAVRAHVVFHTERQAESFVGNTEMRSLPPRMRARVVARRDRQEQIFQRAVREVASTRHHVLYQREAARAIVSACTAIATWYQRGGTLTPDELAERYCHLALAMLGGADATPARPTARRVITGTATVAVRTSGRRPASRSKGDHDPADDLSVGGLT